MDKEKICRSGLPILGIDGISSPEMIVRLAPLASLLQRMFTSSFNTKIEPHAGHLRGAAPRRFSVAAKDDANGF
jgi:hypothetical protein